MAWNNPAFFFVYTLRDNTIMSCPLESFNSKPMHNVLHKNILWINTSQTKHTTCFLNVVYVAIRLSFLNLTWHRKVFFTDYGQIPKVERCDMDGQNRTKLVDSKIVFPHGITLDLVNRLVYWADAYLDYIEVVDYEGKNRHTIIQGLLVRISGQEQTKESKKLQNVVLNSSVVQYFS